MYTRNTWSWNYREQWGRKLATGKPVRCHACKTFVNHHSKLRLERRNYCSADCVIRVHGAVAIIEEAAEAMATARKERTR